MAITVYKQKTVNVNLKKKCFFSSKPWNGEELTKLRPETKSPIVKSRNAGIPCTQIILFCEYSHVHISSDEVYWLFSNSFVSKKFQTP